MDKRKNIQRNIPLIFSVAGCILAAACLWKISTMERQLESMKQTMSGQFSSIQGSIGSMYRMVDEKLEEQGSLLAGSEYELGKADYEGKTVLLRYSVTPKEYLPGETEAVLICRGESGQAETGQSTAGVQTAGEKGMKEYPMRLENGRFMAEFPISLLAEIDICAVQFRENGAVRTQALSDMISPRQEYLGEVYADFNGSWRSEKGEAAVKLIYDGAVDISVIDGKKTRNLRSVSLHAYVDGKEVSVKSLRTFPGDSGEAGRIDESADGGEEPAHRVGETTALKCAFQETYQVPFEGQFELVSVISMDDGLEYRSVIQREAFDEKGEPRGIESADDMRWMGLEASIYDDRGNLLYDALAAADHE